MARKEDKNRPTNESRRRWFKELTRVALAIGGVTSISFLSAEAIAAQSSDGSVPEAGIIAQTKSQDTIPPQPNIDNPTNFAPDKFGDLLTEGVEVHNLGLIYRLVSNNADQYQVRIRKFANKYFPQGVEFFIYDQSIDSLFNGKYLSLYQDPKYDRRYASTLEWSSMNQNYSNNMVYSGVNKDTNVLEIHLGLPLSSGVEPILPPAQPDVNMMISDEMTALIYISAGGPYNDDSEDLAWINYNTRDYIAHPTFALTSSLAANSTNN